MKAVQSFLGEIWALFGVAVAFTFLRMFARIKAVGSKDLQADDYLACLALIFYAGETAIAARGGSLYYSHIDKGIPDPHMIEKLPEDHPGYQIWVEGAKLHLASWPLYMATLWCLKFSLLVLYLRLTVGLSGSFKLRIRIGFASLAATLVAIILTLFLTCRPFGRFFSAHPFPENACQSAVSRPIVWTTLACNVATDLYLMSIPLPMLWHTRIKTWKKVGLVALFSGGLVIVIFAILRCILLTTDAAEGAPLSGDWAVRETFVAVITTNFPMAFTLIRGMLGPAFHSTADSNSSNKDQKSRKDLETIGGGGPSEESGASRKHHPQRPVIGDMLFSPSEELMVHGTGTPLETPSHLSGSTLGSPILGGGVEKP